LDIKIFRSILCLYTEQSLPRASSKLYISSQGLSKQIHALEEQLGLKLFVRSSTGMRPTAFCEAIYPIIQNICNEYDRLENLANQYLSQTGNTITIVIPIGLADVVRVEMIHELRRHFSNFEIVVQEFDSEECRKNLISRKADIAFLTSMTNLAMLDCYEFQMERAAIIVNKNHPLALRKQAVYAQDLYGQMLYRRIYRKTAGDFFRFRTDQTKYDGAQIMAVGYDEKKLLAVTGEGACVLDVKSTMTDVTHPDLVVLDIADISGQIYCCTNKDAPLSEPAKLVLEYMLNYAGGQ
jgi:DNA-binding transcriptional LysR family regulator